MRLDSGWTKLTLALAVVIVTFCPGCSTLPGRNADTARNVIFMVPDGMGLSDVTAARLYLGRRLAFETLEHVGYQSTSSADSTVTDSAAAASAWASGSKFKNGQISCQDEDGNYRCDQHLEPTVLEIAKKLGKATGLVVTSTVSHATPAAWAAHVHSRKCETEIFRQYIQQTGVDVILGGGIGPDIPQSCFTPSPFNGDTIKQMAADSYGYNLVATKTELTVETKRSDKLLGLFSPGAKTPEKFRLASGPPYPPGEPTLAEMTGAALEVLQRSPNGFFLLVEGSQVDWANHGNDQEYQLAEILGFEAAVKQVLGWIAADSRRRSQTLLVVVADHETGGFAVNGPHDRRCKPECMVQGAWTTKGHTAQDTLIWSSGPGSKLLGRALDNTDFYRILTTVMH